jgi:hypothetical protein
MLYFLYTGEITFAPFSSDPRQKLSAQTRTGDWRTRRPPSPSAKSVYRLADKVTGIPYVLCILADQLQYDIPTLKQRARAHIQDNLEKCNIVEEVFSSFSSS